MKATFKLQIHPLAELDIKHAKEWYNLQNEQLGSDFIVELEKSISQILTSPNNFQK